jgi:hypothetical protein
MEIQNSGRSHSGPRKETHVADRDAAVARIVPFLPMTSTLVAAVIVVAPIRTDGPARQPSPKKWPGRNTPTTASAPSPGANTVVFWNFNDLSGYPCRVEKSRGVEPHRSFDTSAAGAVGATTTIRALQHPDATSVAAWLPASIHRCAQPHRLPGIHRASVSIRGDRP